jgi:hypothetical protein
MVDIIYDTIILIPYRNRTSHLEYFLKNTCPIIEELMHQTKIVIIEQCEGKLFNRGKVLNVGFKEYLDKTEYFITNDVDINPTKLCIEKYYKENVEENEVMGIYTSACNTLGGVVKIKGISIKKINGFPNNFWGWGVEDKALQNRSEFFNLKKKENMINNKKYPDFLTIFNDINDRIVDKKNGTKFSNEYQKFNKKSNIEKEKYILSSGLNTLDYKIIERKNLNKIVELIKVEI